MKRAGEGKYTLYVYVYIYIQEDCDIDMTKNIWLWYIQNNILVDECITIGDGEKITK